MNLILKIQNKCINKDILDMSDKPKQNTKPEPRNKKDKGIKAERSLDKQTNLEEVAVRCSLNLFM